ncbi:hypothetical protein [Sphingomonas mollis]|uniref:Uncharacterized protein n=1 Tax=Sphingomonas mollis TaxID=2795726 RepID=A0ABS0XKZ6_9SPHN|nr:hypothetical protein [Sphingomonas sp. BT553]MBJ6120714.1 hypothetical protein [Sphingomonas sp. BT553]
MTMLDRMEEGLLARRRGDAEKKGIVALAFRPARLPRTPIHNKRLRRSGEHRPHPRPNNSDLLLRVSAPPREQIISSFFGPETR